MKIKDYKKIIKAKNMSMLKYLYEEELAENQYEHYLAMKHQDKLKGILWLRKLKEIMKLSAELKKGKVLDLACGIGTFSLQFARLGNKCYGIDFSASMVTKAKKLSAKEKLSNCFYVQANADQLPFADNSFDAIIAVDIIEHLIPYVLQNSLSECYRVLKPGGFLVIHTNPNRYFLLFSHWKKLLLILPFCWLPTAIYEKYLELIQFHFMPIYRRIMGRNAGINPKHINPSTLSRLRKVLGKAGFKIRELYSLNLYIELSPGYLERIRGLLPFYNRQFATRNIFAMASKEK